MQPKDENNKQKQRDLGKPRQPADKPNDPFAQKARQGARQLGDADRFQTMLHRVEKRVDQRVVQSTKPSLLRQIWIPLAAIAATFAILIFNWRPGQHNHQQLATRHFEPLPVLGPSGIQRGQDASSADLTESGFRAYESGHYQEAIQALGQASKAADNQDPVIHLYLGISYLAVDEGTKAAEALAAAQAGSMKDAPFERTCRWYLALAYLNAEKAEQASDELRSLAASPGDYRQQASDLLKEIDGE